MTVTSTKQRESTMDANDIANERARIEVDRKTYNHHLGVSFLLDAFEKTLDALEAEMLKNWQLRQENSQWRVDFNSLKEKLAKAEKEAGWH
jgi:hypothetical protein